MTPAAACGNAALDRGAIATSHLHVHTGSPCLNAASNSLRVGARSQSAEKTREPQIEYYIRHYSNSNATCLRNSRDILSQSDVKINKQRERKTICQVHDKTMHKSSLFTPALLRTHSFVFFAVHETRRICLSSIIPKASRRVSSLFLVSLEPGTKPSHCVDHAERVRTVSSAKVASSCQLTHADAIDLRYNVQLWRSVNACSQHTNSPDLELVDPVTRHVHWSRLYFAWILSLSSRHKLLLSVAVSTIERQCSREAGFFHE